MWSYILSHQAELRPAYRTRSAAEAPGQVFDLDQLAGKLAASSLADPASWPQAPRGTRRQSQRAWEPSPSSLLS